jgi:predicted nucleic acid-binding protein
MASFLGIDFGSFGDSIGDLFSKPTASQSNIISAGLTATAALVGGLMTQSAAEDTASSNAAALAQENDAQRQFEAQLFEQKAALELQLAQIRAAAAGGGGAQGPDRKTIAGVALQRGAENETRNIANLIQGLQGALKLGGRPIG